MPECANIPGRVDVVVVSDTALTASPFSYSKAGPTFRTVGADVDRWPAGAGGKPVSGGNPAARPVVDQGPGVIRRPARW